MSPSDATPDRLLAAATALFANQGFQGTSIRDIAERADANVASGHYHYGSKEGLYLEVLRAQFAEMRSRLAATGLDASAETLRALPRAKLVRLLERRLQAILEVMLGTNPHGALIQREMIDPSAAMPIIVDEFIRPQKEEMETLLAALQPRLRGEALQLMTFSVFGQILFYRFNEPAVLLLLNRETYPRGFTRKVARHVARVTLATLDTLSPERRRRRG